MNMKLNLSCIIIFSFLLAGCGAEYTQEELKTASSDDRQGKGLGKFLGEDGLHFGGAKKREEQDTGLGVNSYLWRATLDIISFMPLSSADPFGGVIITDWYSPPQNSQERLKMNIFILDRQLRSDGLKVSLFRQELNKTGQWIDKPVDSQTVKDLENSILTRARHYRIKSTK